MNCSTINKIASSLRKNVCSMFHRHDVQKHFSSNTKSVETTIDDKTGVAVLTMNHKPVNGMSLEFLTEFNNAVVKLHQDKCRGLIVTSSLPNIFGGGLDLQILTHTTREVVRDIISGLQDVWCLIYGSPMVTIAAINGHALAGGIVFPFAFDYRIMVQGPFKVGLVESAVHVVPPKWVNEATERVMGVRNADLGLQLGYKYTPEECLKLGMVDKICEPNDLMHVAKSEMSKWLAVPDYSRQLVKEHLRRPFIDSIRFRRQEESEAFASRILSDATQTFISNMLSNMKKK